MSKLQEISMDLLAIANIPPEKRNSALLDLSLVVQGLGEYEIANEQKDLIEGIIKDLIAENDADQIAKSKLVFVEDVEEQIAPTKKTRAKKVVPPVVEDESEDLPDFIGKAIPILQLPEPIIKLAGLRRKQLGSSGTIDPDGLLSGVFIWINAPEGDDFWSKIHNEGDLREFKRIYGDEGEKVDELIEFEELNEFVEGLSKPSTSGDLPDNIPFGSLIKNLPEPVKKLALKRQYEAGNIKNENINIVAPKSFDWVITPEGDDFWDEIYKGNLKEFKRIYGDEGEYVDRVIDGLVRFNELLEQADKKVAPAVKTRKARTAKAVAPVVATPVVAKQEVKYVELLFFPPKGGSEVLQTLSLDELFYLTSTFFDKLDMDNLRLNLNVITDLQRYTSKVELNKSDLRIEILEKIVEQFDTFVKPELDWSNFESRKSDSVRVASNQKKLLDAWKSIPKPAPIITPKPVKVVAPKVVTPKPVKVVAPKVVTPKAVKQKVTKPKVEDDLSFLNDLDNIF